MNRILLLLIAVSTFHPVMAQEGFDDYLKAGTSDAATLTSNYVEPLIKGLGYGLGNGWVNTAETHSLLGIDINFSLTFAQIPNSAQFFRFYEQEYDHLTLDNSNSDLLPTIFGPDQAGPSLTANYTDDNGNQQLATFDAPAGVGLKEKLGFNAVPVPITQVGIGLIKNTDLKVRFWPKTNLGTTEASLIGFGLMHDIKQWIPGVKLLPFHWTLFAGYTKLKTNIDLSRAGLDGQNQSGEFGISTATIQTVLSKKIAILTLYSSFGYNKIVSNMAMKGEYIVPSSQVNESQTLVDPLDLQIEDDSFRGSLGMRLKFAVFTLYGDYTFSKYSMINCGMGFSFR